MLFILYIRRTVHAWEACDKSNENEQFGIQEKRSFILHIINTTITHITKNLKCFHFQVTI